MFDILIIIVAIAVVILLQKRHMRDVEALIGRNQRTIENQPDPLTVALGKIPEGNYQAFITNPEAFARAHAAGERVSRLEEYKAREVDEYLKSAQQARNTERGKLTVHRLESSAVKEAAAKAEALEQRAQQLIDDENVFRRSAQLRAMGE